MAEIRMNLEQALKERAALTAKEKELIATNDPPAGEGRKEILDKITQLQIERDERLGNYASHSLDLSDEYERVRNTYIIKLRDLQAELSKLVLPQNGRKDDDDKNNDA